MPGQKSTFKTKDEKKTRPNDEKLEAEVRPIEPPVWLKLPLNAGPGPGD
jgi:hypothetical protein